MSKLGRGRRLVSSGSPPQRGVRLAHGSVSPQRVPTPHPDANRTTQRMPFDQLRELVCALAEHEAPVVPVGDDDIEEAVDEAVAEFETQKTTFRPSPKRIVPRRRTPPPPPPSMQRLSTLDDLIHSLQSPARRR